MTKVCPSCDNAELEINGNNVNCPKCVWRGYVRELIPFMTPEEKKEHSEKEYQRFMDDKRNHQFK